MIFRTVLGETELKQNYGLDQVVINGYKFHNRPGVLLPFSSQVR